MAADPYTTPQNPVSAPVAARVRPGAAFSRALPGIATTAVLGLGRYWHAHGAAHSIGDAILAGARERLRPVLMTASLAARGSSGVSPKHGPSSLSVATVGEAIAGADVVILALPATLCGIVTMLFITGTTLSVRSLMGAIMSIGVASANSILLVTFAREQQLRGHPALEAALSAGVATGIQFWPATSRALHLALSRLSALWRDRPVWERVQRNGMAADVSWRGPANRYHAPDVRPAGLRSTTFFSERIGEE